MKSDDCFILKSKHLSSLPVEASYSKSVPFGRINLTFESCSLALEAKEFNEIGSLIELNYSTLKSNDCLNFREI